MTSACLRFETPRTSSATALPVRHEPLRHVVILKADRLSAEALRQMVDWVLPAAVVKLARTVGEAGDLLCERAVDLFVTGFNPQAEGDVLGLLGHPTRVGDGRRIMVLIEREEDRLVSALRKFPIHGVFDAGQEEPEALARAVHTVAHGGSFWSASYWTRLNRHSRSGSLASLLTTTEQIVLSLAGSGDDNATVARALALSVSTVATVRRNLHRKLCVQSRGELIRAAAQHGFVHFTADGVLRPGFALLMREYDAIRKTWVKAGLSTEGEATPRAPRLRVMRSVESPGDGTQGVVVPCDITPR